jgi:hypothetical protein
LGASEGDRFSETREETVRTKDVLVMKCAEELLASSHKDCVDLRPEMIVSISADSSMRWLGWCAGLRAKVVSFDDSKSGWRRGLVNVQLEGMNRRFESKVLTKKLFVQIAGRWLHEWTPAYELTLAAQARESGVPLPPVDSRVRVRKRLRGALTEPLESESASGEESDQQSSAEDAAAGDAVGETNFPRRARPAAVGDSAAVATAPDALPQGSAPPPVGTVVFVDYGDSQYYRGVVRTANEDGSVQVFFRNDGTLDDFGKHELGELLSESAMRALQSTSASRVAAVSAAPHASADAASSALPSTTPSAKNSSKYRGVCWAKREKKWVVRIRHKNKRISLGVFNDEHAAARAYDKAAIRMRMRERVNFPEEEYEADTDVVLAAVAQNGMALGFTSSAALKADKDFVLAAVAQKGDALRYAAAALKADKDVVLAAVTQDGIALWFADAALKADKDVVLAAVAQDGRALNYADAALQRDPDVRRAAASK